MSLDPYFSLRLLKNYHLLFIWHLFALLKYKEFSFNILSFDLHQINPI